MSWVALLPYVLQIVVFILQRVKASNDVILKFQAFVESTKNEGLISVAASDKFKTLHEQLMQKAKGESGGNQEGTAP